MRTKLMAGPAMICALLLSAAPAAAAQSPCTDLGGNLQSGDVCHAQDITSEYMIDFRFAVGHPEDGAVAAFLAKERDRVIGLARAPGAAKLPYSLWVTSVSTRSGQPQRTTLGYNNNAIPNTPQTGTRSLLLKVLADIETAPSNSTYKSFVFDFDQRRPVTLENLFAAGVNPVDVLSPVVAADLARQFHVRGFAVSDGIRDPATYRSFTITDDAVTFYIDQSAVLPARVGGLISVVPRSKIPPLQI
ncbi:RsiV family protein [Mycolicibacterium sp. P9-22]|uniref:RsiV family protein n=1 Tax=Mycolicibacterium sp. P9-22 TaxID=2024613 RepID=UPI0011EE1E45|nr:RsiV family protein [Mycolicibacterium sp. P9-22]